MYFNLKWRDMVRRGRITKEPSAGMNELSGWQGPDTKLGLEPQIKLLETSSWMTIKPAIGLSRCDLEQQLYGCVLQLKLEAI